MNTFTRTAARFAAGLTDGLMAARHHHALSRMSDRQLADIGLSRENISLRALELAQRR